MVADALTKGGVDRKLIEDICERCRLTIAHEVLKFVKANKNGAQQDSTGKQPLSYLSPRMSTSKPSNLNAGKFVRRRLHFVQGELFVSECQ